MLVESKSMEEEEEEEEGVVTANLYSLEPMKKVGEVEEVVELALQLPPYFFQAASSLHEKTPCVFRSLQR
mgnify:FL=1